MATRYRDIGAQYFDANNKPNGGAELTFLDLSGDEITTYYDEALTVPNPNPVILDAAGRQPDIWIDDGVSYTVSADPPITLPVPVVSEPALVYTATQTFQIFVSAERVPSMQDTILQADPTTGKVIGFLEGKNDFGGARKYVTSSSPWTSWTAYNMSSIPMGAEGNTQLIGAGMTMHPDKHWTIAMVGTGNYGICHSEDDGATWVRESPLLDMNAVFNQTWSPVAIDNDTFTMLVRKSTTSEVMDMDPDDGGYTLGTDDPLGLVTSWNTLVYNGRRFYGDIGSTNILEWDSGTSNTSSGVPASRPWIRNGGNMIVVDRVDGSNKSTITYTLCDLSGAAMSDVDATDYTVQTSFVDTCQNSACCGGGNGLFVLMVQERVNQNTATDQVAVFTGTDGVNWSEQTTITLPSTPKTTSNNGIPMHLIWVGAENWLLKYRGTDNVNRVCTMTVDLFGLS